MHEKINILYLFFFRRDTFMRLTEWLSETRENSHPNVLIVLVGNQNDRKDECVTYPTAVIKINMLNIFY